MPNMVHLASFWKPEIFGQTVLPDMSLLIGQNLVENVKIEKYIWDILGIFKHCDVRSNQSESFHSHVEHSNWCQKTFGEKCQKFKTWNATFLLIFKHYESVVYRKYICFRWHDNNLIWSISGLWGEIRSWEDGTTIVQKTHDANKHHVQAVRN